MTKSLTAGGIERTGPRLTVVVVFLSLLLLIMAGVASVWAPRAFSAAAPNDEATLLDGYRHVEVASVSDAIEKVSGQRMYMSHRMRPIFSSKFAGVALTVQLKKEENRDPGALQGMLAAIRFDNDARLEGDEIDDVIADGRLTAEFDAGKSAVAESIPELSLRIGHVLAQLTPALVCRAALTRRCASRIATLSRKGRGGWRKRALTFPSPLAGEGARPRT